MKKLRYNVSEFDYKGKNYLNVVRKVQFRQILAGFKEKRQGKSTKFGRGPLFS